MCVKINYETEDFVAVCDKVLDALSDFSCDDIAELFNRICTGHIEHLGDGEFKVDDDDDIIGFAEVLDKLQVALSDFSGDELAEMLNEHATKCTAVYVGDSLFFLFDQSDLVQFERDDTALAIIEENTLFGFQYEGIEESCQYRSRHEAVARAYLKCVDDNFVF